MSSSKNLGDVFTGGATTSQHVDAEDDDHFQNTTFKLKRTRSLGLLDEFIEQTGADEDNKEEPGNKGTPIKDESGRSPLEKPKEDFNSERNVELESDDRSFKDVNASEDDSSDMKRLPASLTSPEILPHDDTDIQTEPSRHVDYLSHQWDVSDISKSWRYVTQKRKDVANAARLENASWRTWAQRRSNLKTISPEAVNWSKDSDVTWLYGPILKDDNNSNYDDVDHHKRVTTATSAVAGDISIPNKENNGPKPILKRRTVQDMMISHSNLLKLQLATNRMNEKSRQQQILHNKAKEDQKDKKSNDPPEYDDYDAISEKLNTQYKINSSGGSISSSIDINNKTLLPEKGYIPESSLGSPSTSSLAEGQTNEKSPGIVLSIPQSNNQASSGIDGRTSSSLSSKERRHIHFNDEVQQCRAVEVYSDDDDDNDEYYDYGADDDDEYYNDDDSGFDYDSNRDQDSDFDENNEDDEDEEGGFFLNVKSLSSGNISAPGLSSKGSTSPDKGTDAYDEFSQDEQRPSYKSNTEDTASISTNNSKVYKTIHILPPTTLNYGSSDEESDDQNPYMSSLSHNVNNSRGYDYYYDYNTVYTIDPNHAIYGTVDHDEGKVPDVVDVPENITMGSNFDYKLIEERDMMNGEKEPHEIYMKGETRDGASSPAVMNQEPVHKLESPADSTHGFGSFNDNSGRSGDGNRDENIDVDRTYKSTNTSDSENDESDDSDDGLLIKTRRSSQSLAQQVFSGSSMTALSEGNDLHFPKDFTEPTVASAHISAINPNHSSSSISKQPRSSGSLSQLFFGDGLTPSDEHSNDLAKAFFNAHDSNTTSSSAASDRSSESGSKKNISNTQRKTSPLPPQTTSTNAFRESSGCQDIPRGGGFSLHNGSSLDESEDESGPLGNKTSSYVSLSHVADKNRITSVSPEPNENPSDISSQNSANSNNSILQGNNLMNQAKGIASHLLNNWKNND